MSDPPHLRMARTSGAQGLGFDPSEVLMADNVEKIPEDPWVDRDDVKYETKDDSAKEQYGVIRAATFERLVCFCFWFLVLFFCFFF